MPLNLLLILVGAGLLLGGGELLVRGAAALARSLGVSAMIVGLTVVAYGTSAPELIVSIMATLNGKPGICSGNIVGSNILNVLLVLGATALICPVRARADFVRREVPSMAGLSILFLILAWDGSLARWEAALLFALLLAYTYLAIRIAKREKADVESEYEDVQSSSGKKSTPVNLLLVGLGLVLLVGGSKVFLMGAIKVARAFDVSEAIIGLTLVAMGTSLPELVACLIAAYRKHPDICLGNIIGSSIYNMLAIGGVAGMMRPLPFESEMVRVHIPVMVGAAVILWPMVATRLKVGRREGLVLLGCYAAYMAWTIWQQT